MREWRRRSSTWRGKWMLEGSNTMAYPLPRWQNPAHPTPIYPYNTSSISQSEVYPLSSSPSLPMSLNNNISLFIFLSKTRQSLRSSILSLQHLRTSCPYPEKSSQRYPHALRMRQGTHPLSHFPAQLTSSLLSSSLQLAK